MLRSRHAIVRDCCSFLVALASACTVGTRGDSVGSGKGAGDSDPEGDGAQTSDGADGDDGADGGSDGDDGATDDPLFDVGGGNADPGGDCPVPPHTPCDGDPDDPVSAIGLGCPGEPDVTVTINAHPSAIKTWASFGDTSAFDPREGSRFAVISTASLEEEFAEGHTPTSEECWDRYSEDNSLPGYDYYPAPEPLVFEDVGPVTCDEDPTLVGTGDCSNTLESTDSLGCLRDYAEIRVNATVPAGATSLSFNSAFLTLEYPDYWHDIFNDFYFVWLESDTWTGNIAFDDYGEVISVNAAFMEYLDADVIFGPNFEEHPECPKDANCTAPELHGTCMANHGATAWLTTKVGVTPGDEIELVFGIADVADEQLDSIAFIDNFQWGCDDGGPETRPEG